VFSADPLRNLPSLLAIATVVTLIQLAVAGCCLLVRPLIRRQRIQAQDGTLGSGPSNSRGMPERRVVVDRRKPGPLGEENLTRDQAVEALRRAEAKYRSIFENAVEGIFQTTADGRYLSANPALARIYDYDSPEHLIASIGDIERQLYVDPNRRDEFIRIMDEQGVVSNFESEIFRRDGSIIWISENARAVRTPDGDIEYYEGKVEDISERKQAESLFREKEAAEAANRAKSQFLAHMSHELRTPLNGVIGMIDLLYETTESPQHKRYASIARSSADLLLTVINQILDFSKIESGKMDLESIDFDFRLLVEETLEMVAPKAEQKQVELALNMSPEVSSSVQGDPHRLRQVIVNLLGNAIKFTQHGRVEVRVTPENDATEPPLVRVTVEDTGIGIPSDRLNRLFQSFSQVDASTTREFGGTGLGLAISKQLVELMGGTIGVESEVNRGSSFWFCVPLRKALAAQPACNDSPPELQGLRFLVVDDNATNREILFRQLSAWGVRVETAADGVQALQLLHRANDEGDRIETAIIDSHMPEMDGLELARRIRADNALQSTPLVMLTSLSMSSAGAEVVNLGFVDCLTKPVRQSHLFNTIMGIAMGQQRPASPMQSSQAHAPGEPIPKRPPSALPSNDKGRPGVRLLLVEDNEINRMVALEVLGLAGFECEVAGTGRTAIEQLLATPYDIVLMDCQMPEMDGLTATRKIRRLEAEGPLRERGYRVPIVAITANATEGDRELCEAAGMDGYLTKPIDSLKLIQLLEVMLGSTGATSAAGSAKSVIEPRSREREATRSGKPQSPDIQAASQPALNESPFDLEALSHRCLGNRDLMQRILPRFVDRLPAVVAAIENAFRQGKLGEVAAQAHALKGAAANLSAKRLQRLAGDLELACRGNMATATACVEAVRREMDRCIEFAATQASTIGQPSSRVENNHRIPPFKT
jgi:PAS domain S-box-containing protein